jgi:hypothetical protein
MNKFYKLPENKTEFDHVEACSSSIGQVLQIGNLKDFKERVESKPWMFIFNKYMQIHYKDGHQSIFFLDIK